MSSGLNRVTHLTRCPEVALVVVVVQIPCLCPPILGHQMLASAYFLALWARAPAVGSRWASSLPPRRARCRAKNVSSLPVPVVLCLSLVPSVAVPPRWYARLVKVAQAVTVRVASAARMSLAVQASPVTQALSCRFLPWVLLWSLLLR